MFTTHQLVQDCATSIQPATVCLRYHLRMTSLLSNDGELWGIGAGWDFPRTIPSDRHPFWWWNFSVGGWASSKWKVNRNFPKIIIFIDFPKFLNILEPFSLRFRQFRTSGWVASGGFPPWGPRQPGRPRSRPMAALKPTPGCVCRCLAAENM